MTNYDEFDLDADGEMEDLAELNIEEMKSKLPNFQIEKICEIIVCNRYFNFNHELTVYCMQELAKRRAAGDSFNFEEYIENSFKALPVLNVALPDLRTMLTQVVGKKLVP